eukprot:jgi/Galph1/4949/GphlegSOOS_G3620.1
MAHTLSSAIPSVNDSVKIISVVDEEDIQTMANLHCQIQVAKGQNRESCQGTRFKKETGMMLRNGKELPQKTSSETSGILGKRLRATFDDSYHDRERNCYIGEDVVTNNISSGFDSIPTEVLAYIFNFLTDVVDIVNIRSVCKRFRRIYSSQLLFSKLDFISCRYITDDMIKSWCGSSFLPLKCKFKEISLSKCHRLCGKGLVQLFKSVNVDYIESLNIRWCTLVDDSAVMQLCKMRHLKTLRMSHTTQISPTVLAMVFENVTSLRVLDISFTKCNLQALSKLNCKCLVELILQGVADVDDETIEFLSPRLSMLEKLDLSWCPRISNRSLFSIALNCHNLKEIGLSETKISDEGLCELLRSCRKLHSIQISRCSLVHNAVIEMIVRDHLLKKRLTCIDLSSCHRITDSVVNQLLMTCKNLRFVDVSKLPCRRISCPTISALRRRQDWKEYGITLVLILSWFGLSTGIILITKWTVSEVPGFKFPLLITTTNNVGTFLWAYLFVRLTHWGIHSCTKEQLLFSFLPISVGIACEIGLSNIALSFLSVALSTLLKGSAPLFVMFWGVFFHTEVFRLNLFFSILLTCLGLALTCVGNYSGNVVGMVLQLLAVAAGGFRWCLSQVLLQNHSDPSRVSALEMTLYTAPLTALVLLPFVLVIEGKSLVLYWIETETRTLMYMSFVLLLVSFFVFLLLLIEYILVRRTSSLAMAVASVFKEGTTIVGGSIWFHDRISLINIFGFVLCQLGILWYIWSRVNYGNHLSMENEEMNEEELLATDEHGISESTLIKSIPND